VSVSFWFELTGMVWDNGPFIKQVVLTCLLRLIASSALLSTFSSPRDGIIHPYLSSS